MWSNNDEVATYDDLMQILRHKLECLPWLGIDDIDRQLPWTALQNTMLDPTPQQ